MKAKIIYIFDAYGTLLDIDTACKKMVNDLGEDWLKISKIWRQKQLEYSWLANSMNYYINFWEITQNALSYTMNMAGIKNKKIERKLLEYYMKPNTYSDARIFLENLKKANIETCILTNGNNAMIRPAINHSNINSLINKIFSVERCKKFKPAEEVYNLVFEHYNLEKDKFIFCSSNCWDIHGASKFGYTTVWINRNKDSEDILPGKIDKIVNSFDELNLEI